MRNLVRAIAVPFLAAVVGCTVHPDGERAERNAAIEAGKPFERRIEDRDLTPLPENPAAEDLVRCAFFANAELEQRYWEWRSAIEQIPQDGTQATNLALSANVGLLRGATRWDQTALSAGNDPMADIVLPPKLSAAARRSLQNARAAGLRFRKTQFDLRNKVLIAYYDYALTAELIRLEQSDAELLKTIAMVTEARNQAGAAGQQDVLKASNEVDLSANDLANMQAQLPVQRAMLNGLLSRRPDASLAPPSKLPRMAEIDYSDRELLAKAASQNPELAALAREMAGRMEGIALAQLQYLPDISVSASSDLQGMAQSLIGSLTVPWLRHEAIDAAVAQAQANLRVTESMSRQFGSDLDARVVLDIATLRDASRQLDLFDHTILPRAGRIVTLARSAYESGHSSLLDVLDGRRSLISIQRLVANLRIIRAKRVADLEAITATELTPRHLPESR